MTAVLDGAPSRPRAPRAPGVAVVVERELLRAGRRWQTWAWRVGAAAALLLLVGTYWSNEVVDAGRLYGPTNLAYLGRRLFEVFSMGLFLLVAVLTPVMVGQAVIEERNGGTLTLLALTKLTPRQLLGGKLLSRFILLEAVIVAGLPAMAVAMSLGGVEPRVLASAFLQANAAILGLGAVSVFVSLYARTPLVPAMAAWAWAFVAWLVATVPVMLGGGDDDWATAVSPFVALLQPGEPYVLGPLLITLPTAFAALVLGGRAFGLAMSEEDGHAELLHSGFWDLDRMLSNASLGALVTLFGLLPLGIVLALVHESRVAPDAVGALAAWLWTMAALVFGTVLYLFAVRWGLRFLQQRRDAARAARAALIEVHRDRPRQARARSLSGLVPSRARAVALRPVWRNPVAWREVVTAAYGGFVPFLGKAWIAALLLLLAVMAFGGVDADDDAAIAIAFLLINTAWLLTVVAACASVAGDLQRHTLPLLLATGFDPRQVVRGKLAGILAVGGPPMAAGLCFALVGVSEFGGRRYYYDAWEAYDGLFWRWLSIALCALAAQAFLAVSTLAIGLRTGQPGRAWIAGLSHALGWGVVPVIALLMFEGFDPVEVVIALINPMLNKEWYDPGVPPLSSFVSAAGWFAVAGFLAWRLPHGLRRQAAR